MNTEFKGTKGEWKYIIKHRGSTKNSLIQVVLPNDRILNVGEIDKEDHCLVTNCCCVEQHANAKLIATAPELLEALIEIINNVDNSVWNHPSLEKGKQAIQKALNP